jgi:general secretion pathway protein K
MIRKRKEAGAALLSILLIVAALSVAALIATEAIARQTELHKLGSRKTMAVWASRSAEALAISVAAELVQASRLPADTDTEKRQAQLAFPVEGGQITLILEELPPCLNLNALGSTDPAVHAHAASALRILLEDMGMPSNDAVRSVAVLADWIDADNDTRPYGAEDSDYLAQNLSYRASNQPLTDLHELAAIPEFTPSLRAALRPFVCALPQSEMMTLNLNALTPMSAQVLRASAGGRISMTEARRFIDNRPAAGWANVQQARDSVLSQPQLESALSVLTLSTQGEYFSGKGTATLDAGRWTFRFLMQAGSGRKVVIVAREVGGAE